MVLAAVLAAHRVPDAAHAVLKWVALAAHRVLECRDITAQQCTATIWIQ